MNYKYTAYTPENQIVKGRVSVSTEEAAIETLKQSGLNILSLKRTRGIKIEDILPTFFTVRDRDVVLFSRQLAMLLDRGVPFLVALKLAREQVNNRILNNLLGSIIKDVEAGSTFSSAVARYPDTFPLTFSRMMKVGEESGNLEVVLREVASHMERDEESTKRIRSALVYPALILLMGIATVIVLVTTVLPSMLSLFEQFGTDLPWPTRLTRSLASFLDSYGLFVLAGAALVAVLVIWYARSRSGKYHVEKFVLKLPWIGRIRLLRNLSQFSRIASILLSAGLPVTEVISVAHQSVQSEIIRHELAHIPDSLMQGQGLARSMRASKLFPSMLVQMVITGEETNTLDSSFAALAEHYDFEFTQSLNVFISMLEPALILIVGLAVGFIAVSAMMPIYSIYDVMS